MSLLGKVLVECQEEKRGGENIESINRLVHVVDLGIAGHHLVIISRLRASSILSSPCYQEHQLISSDPLPGQAHYSARTYPLLPWSTPTTTPNCELGSSSTAVTLSVPSDSSGDDYAGLRPILTACNALSSNDALRAQGILPPKPPSRSPSPDIPHITHADAVRAIAATADADQLVTLLEGDNLDSDDERMFEEYRQKRLGEMKKEEKRGRFGSMEPLGREDFVKEVTEGSRRNLDGEVEAQGGDDEDDEEEEVQDKGRLKGTGVVVFLFKDS